MKKLLLILVMLALIICACDKDDDGTSNPLVPPPQVDIIVQITDWWVVWDYDQDKWCLQNVDVNAYETSEIGITAVSIYKGNTRLGTDRYGDNNDNFVVHTAYRFSESVTLHARAYIGDEYASTGTTTITP